MFRMYLGHIVRRIVVASFTFWAAMALGWAYNSDLLETSIVDRVLVENDRSIRHNRALPEHGATSPHSDPSTISHGEQPQLEVKTGLKETVKILSNHSTSREAQHGRTSNQTTHNGTTIKHRRVNSGEEGQADPEFLQALESVNVRATVQTYYVGMPRGLDLPGPKLCKEYKSDLERRFTFAADVLTSSHPDSDVMTLVTHGSSSRMDVVMTLLGRWSGPVSLALYTPARRVANVTAHIRDSFHNRTNIGLHIVLDDHQFYPNNLLREIAANYSHTDYLFLNDLDFIPSDNAEDILTRHAKSMNPKELLVVPAFQFTRANADFMALKNKTELIKAKERHHVASFHHRLPTHRSTDFQRWYNSSNPFPVTPNSRFEPYVVIRREDMQPYPKFFLDRGNNKIAFFLLLTKRGYHYKVLPDVHIVHLQHKDRTINRRAIGCTSAVLKYFNKMLNK